MRRNKIVVAIAATIPPQQAQARKQGLASALGMNEDDVVVVDGVSGLAVVPDDTPPHQSLTELLAPLLEQNRHRIHRGRFEDVATDLGWAIENAGWHQTPGTP